MNEPRWRDIAGLLDPTAEPDDHDQPGTDPADIAKAGNHASAKEEAAATRRPISDAG